MKILNIFLKEKNLSNNLSKFSMLINFPLIISVDSHCSKVIVFILFINADWKIHIFHGVKLEELRYVVYSDKFLEERFRHVLPGFIFVRRKFLNEHL